MLDRNKLKKGFSVPAHLYLPSGFWVTAFVLFFLVGCDKDHNDDLTPPAIHIVETIPELTSAEICEAQSDLVLPIEVGGTLEITMRFTDDVALGSAKIDLHHNFDCHGHKSTVWSLIEIIELEGREAVVHRSFTPPDDVRPGLYHLGIMAIDEAGQEAVPIFFDLVVRDTADTEAPEVILHQPTEGAQVSLNAPLLIEGEITDDVDLGTGGYDLIFISPTGIELSVARVDFPEDQGDHANFSHKYNIPAFVGPGEAEIKIVAHDWRNNSKIKYLPISVVD